jgi:NAD(P)-dependent dehydrogenase (short-subunit alcohol dehydrogenase family)
VRANSRVHGRRPGRSGRTRRTRGRDRRTIRWTLDRREQCRRVRRHLRASGRGAIVNISSRAATRAARGFAAYTAAKGGLEALTRSIAVDEARHGVRCNAISPGYVLNERRDADLSDEERTRRQAMHLLGLGTADDVAHAAVYLASQESRWLTGSVLPLDGGSSAARGSFS